MVIRSSNLKSHRGGTSEEWSEDEYLLGPNQRGSSMYSSH